uniref:Uncharacterized protein n=1 Tax=Spongospora subterranea TaxID=70186 RepID=A0A0H5QKL7_9EUKA|eukprot:CRZ02172.1 hypothetical protein [Spongospora subterranea]
MEVIDDDQRGFGQDQKSAAPRFEHPELYTSLLSYSTSFAIGALLFQLQCYAGKQEEWMQVSCAVTMLPFRQRIYRFNDREGIVNRRRAHIAQNTRRNADAEQDFVYCVNEYIEMMRLSPSCIRQPNSNCQRHRMQLSLYSIAWRYDVW